MESTTKHTRKFTSRGVEDYIIQYPRTIYPTVPDSSLSLAEEKEEEEGSSLTTCAVQGSSAAQLRGHRTASERTHTPPCPVHSGPPGMRQDGILRRTAWLKMKYRQRTRLHMHRKRVESQQIEQLEMCETRTHSPSLPPPPPPPPPPVSAAGTISSHDPPPLLRLLDPQDKGIFSPRPVLTVTLQDYFGATNILLHVSTEGIQSPEVARMILRELRHPHESLPVHYYRLLHVFTPHRMHTVAPDKVLVPQSPSRAIAIHTDSTYFLTLATSHYKVEEDEKLEYCHELLPCGRDLQEARYSEVLRDRCIALLARVRTREDMLRLVEGVGGGQLQLEGSSMDEAMMELVHYGFSSDPEEMMYKCGELDEFWKEKYEDGHDGWRLRGCLPHPATIEAPKVVKEQVTPYVTSFDMGPRERHWYPDYQYLRRAMAAAVSGRQLLERLTEELAYYRHHVHHLSSITPIELFTDDREALLEHLYEEALAEHVEEQQQAFFLKQLEAKQFHVSSNHLAGIIVLRQLPSNFNNFRFCLDMCAYVLSIHAYDLALKMAIKEFCDLRGYYLFRSTIMRLIRKDRKEILEVFKDSKKFMFGFINQRESTTDPGTPGECLTFNTFPGHPDDWGRAVPSEYSKAPGISEHLPDMTLHRKGKEHRNKASRQGRKPSQNHVRGKLKGFQCRGMMNTNQRSKFVHWQHTNHVCIQNETNGKYKHHRNYDVLEQLRTGPVSMHCRTDTVLESQLRRPDTVSHDQINDISPEQHTTSTVSQHHITVTGPLNHESGAVPDHQKTGTKSKHHKTNTISRHHRANNEHVHNRINTAPQHHRTGTVPEHHSSSIVSKHHRTSTVLKHHRIGTVLKHHRTDIVRKHHRTSNISKHHRIGIVPKHHRTGILLKHHKIGTISKYHITGTVLKHYQTDTLPKYHRSNTIPEHHMTATVPEHRSICIVSQYHRTKTLPYLSRTDTLPRDQHNTIQGHHRTGTVSQYHKTDKVSECNTYARDWKQHTVDTTSKQFIINKKSKKLRNGCAPRQNTPALKQPGALLCHHDRMQGNSNLETTSSKKTVKNNSLSNETDQAKYRSCKLSCPQSSECKENSGYNLDTCRAENKKELSMVFCNGESTAKVSRLFKKQELTVTQWQSGGGSASSAGYYDGDRVFSNEKEAVKCDAEVNDNEGDRICSGDTKCKDNSVLSDNSDGDRSSCNDGEDGVKILDGENEVDGDRILSSENEDVTVVDHGIEDESDRVIYGESKGDLVHSNESGCEEAADNKGESEHHRIFIDESESEGNRVINSESESEGDQVIDGENKSEGSLVLVNESEDNRFLSGESETEGDKVLDGESDIVLNRESKENRVFDGKCGDADDRILGGESQDDKVFSVDTGSEGDIAITGEKEGDRILGRETEGDIVFERDYEGGSNTVHDRDDCRSGPNERYTLAHSETSGIDKKYESSQWCDNDSISFLSNVNSDEMKIFVGSSEDEVTISNSGARISQSKDSSDYVAETDTSEGYTITSSDDSDSHHETVHNDDVDAGDNSATSYDSDSKKGKTVTTGLDSIGNRVPNSSSEFSDSSSGIISCDTSGDVENCTSGSSDEKKERYTGPNDNSNSDTVTLNGNGMRQRSNAAEVHYSQKEMDDTVGKKERRGRRRKISEMEEPLWEAVAPAEPEGDLTSWGTLQFVYGNLTSLLQKWDHYSYLVRVFRRAYKMECERWREVVKRAHMHITLHFQEMEKRKEARTRGGWYKFPKKAPCMNTRVKYQGRKSLYGTRLWWMQNHIRWLVQYDVTLNLKHRALICLVNKEQARPSGSPYQENDI